MQLPASVITSGQTVISDCYHGKWLHQLCAIQPSEEGRPSGSLYYREKLVSLLMVSLYRAMKFRVRTAGTWLSSLPNIVSRVHHRSEQQQITVERRWEITSCPISAPWDDTVHNNGGRWRREERERQGRRMKLNPWKYFTISCSHYLDVPRCEGLAQFEGCCFSQPFFF